MNAITNVPVVVTVATLYAAVYQILVILGPDIRVVLGLFALSPFVLCYMAYVILRYGKPSESTFEERFYDDWDHERIGSHG